jgi:hypothetical protein
MKNKNKQLPHYLSEQARAFYGSLEALPALGDLPDVEAAKSLGDM